MGANLILPAGSAAADSTPADPVTRSLRFNDGDNSTLYIDPTVNHDSTTVYTFSCWAKLGEMDAESYEIFTAGYYASGGADQNLIYFGHNADSKLRLWLRSTADSTNTTYTSTAVFRDPSAWYHLLLVRNGASLKVYVNNTEVISQTISSTQRYGVGNGYPMHVGSSLAPTSTGLTNYGSFDGLLADIYFTDGYAKSPTDFIESNDYGGYKPKEYTGSFGTNGFHIDAQPAHDADLLVTSVGRNDGDTDFVDVAKGHTVSRYGNTHHDNTAGNPFGSGTAIYFDGSGDYLNIGTTSDFRTTTNNFTLDFWFKPNGSSLGSVFSNVNDGNVYDGLTVSVSSVSISVSLRNSSSSNNVVTLNYTNDDTNWHHVEVSRTGSTLYLFVDGNLEDSGSISFTPTNSGLVARVGRIYASSYPSSNNYAGYLFDYRWSNSGGHTASFTAPTAPLELNPVYLGGDQSGNKNHFTPTGISSHDVMLDTPTTNYCLINPLSETKTDSNNYTPNPTTGLSEGNLKLTSPSIWYNGHGTLGVSSGKWYFEWYSTGDYALGGFSTSEMFSNSNQSITDWWILYNRDSSNNIELRYKDGTSTTGATWAGGSHASGNGNVYGCAFDVDNRKMYFHKNGDWSDGTSTLTSTFPSSYGGDLTGSSHNIPADTTFYPILRAYAPSTVIANFGQDSTFANTVASGSANAADTNGNGDFRYAPPSGYLALCAANLDAPTVTPEEHFNTRLYLGTRDNSTSIGFTSNAVTGVGFKPELLWIKDRDNASSNYGSNYYGNFLFDAVQGTGKAINTDGGMYTGSNDFSSNLDGYNGVSSFDSDGFTVDEAEAVNYAYDSDYNGSLDGYERYVAWGWKLGSNGSSSTWANGNTDPTTEKYNASAGVSVIRQVETSGNYPMTGVTVNHSLGAAPEFAFLADTSGNTQNVYAWHKDLAANKYLRLNANSAQTTGSGYFPSGCSTATTFQIGGDIAGANGYDGWWDIYMYLFTSVEGMVKIGSWVGNGSTDGPMVYCGFRPSLILAKAVNRSNSWYMWDDQRDGYNVTDAGLWADLSGAESHASTNKVDILSNGFKLRGSGNGTNSSSNNNYIFIAWAHSPFSKANSF